MYTLENDSLYHHFLADQIQVEQLIVQTKLQYFYYNPLLCLAVLRNPVSFVSLWWEL